MINVSGLAEVIINIVIHYRGIPKSIITDRGLLFISKFWSLLCYFLRIKKKLFTAFYFQTNSQTKGQNSTMKAYFRTFVNWKQNNLAKLLPMAKFGYNNAKNASTSHTPFKLNCDYHPRVLFEENVNFCSKSCSADKLAEELRKLMKVCCQNLLHI